MADDARNARRLVLYAVGAVVAFGMCLILAVPLFVVFIVASVGGGDEAKAANYGKACDSNTSQADLGGTVGGLSDAQTDNAYSVYLQGKDQDIPEFGIVIALATASQESSFLNYANDGKGGDLAGDQQDIAKSLDLPHDDVGSDHGSLGIFQQQYPWWGSMKALMTPQKSAKRFYDALRKIKGWEDMELTVAAQAVQASASPSAYADDEDRARQLYEAFEKHGDPADVQQASDSSKQCGPSDAMACPATDLNVEQGLMPDALRVLRCVDEEFGRHTYIGVGERSTNPESDHPTGRAVDIMIEGWESESGNSEGDEIAAWVREHAAELGVTYVIWDERIWSVARNDEGWREYTHPSGASDSTSLHRDHVHVSVEGNGAGGEEDGAVNVGDGEAVLPLESDTYTLTSPYGRRGSPTTGESELHGGQDMAAPVGTPIRATLAGKVTDARWCHDCGFGYFVVVRTGNTEIYYAHQSKMRVSKGDKVEAGDVIGEVGSTGNSTGAHLHFEVRVNNTAVDPMKWLRQRGLSP